MSTMENSPTPGETISVGQVKRVLEWWSSSQAFRDAVSEDTAKAGQDFGLGFDPAPLRPLWDSRFGMDMHARGEPFHPAVLAYRAFYDGKTVWRDEIKMNSAPPEPRFRAWRQRQVERNKFENGAYDDSIIHTPLAIELTDGCTVGCWFCGVGATKFADFMPYAENKDDWRQILKHLHDKLDDAGRWGFLYWATDPLDNPDYEFFANDFADVFGVFPQTTTAQPQKHIDRLRTLLPMSEARGCRVNRFSIQTERQLKEIYAAFSPDEMQNVEIVSQMKEATAAKANTGQFRVRATANEDIKTREMDKLAATAKQWEAARDDGRTMSVVEPGTIACVSGFLLNMVKKTVKLISPCRASERWPLGYIVYDEATFDTPEDLNATLDQMIDRHMGTALDEDTVARFHPMLTHERTDDGFTLTSPFHGIAMERPAYRAYVHFLGDTIRRGDRTAGQIAVAGLFMHGVPEANTLATLTHLMDMGILVDRHGRIERQKVEELA
ncbi:MAG: hypothetical protein VR70_09950 [Rhodospirillaceae bacterium BRH_c57]|nr:MAG: hypothetical protein VR70_09950 [Rhodospirillaceae bacterium BRH_c57]